MDGVQRAVRQPARQEEAGQACRGLREHQKGVAHGCAEEPLVAGQAKARAPGIAAIGLGARGVGADVGAALLLRHAHAHGDGCLAFHGDEARVVECGRQLGPPGRLQRSITAQGRCHRIAHGHRAQHRRLGLGEQHEGRGARDVRTRPTCPRRAVQAMFQRAAQQRVVAGVELHLIHAAAHSVVRVQHGRVRVGQARVHLHVRAAGLGAQGDEGCGGQGGRVQRQGVLQRSVGMEQVDAAEGRRLVEDLVCGHTHACLLISQCGMPSSR